MAYMMIKPTDTLFFRGGKPFDAGVDSWSDSGFLPNPSVIWGAMFSVLYRQSLEIQDKVSDKNDSTDFAEYLKIKSIYLYNEKDGRVLLPAPLDLFIEEDSNKVVQERYLSNIITSDELSKLEFATPDSTKKTKRADSCFIDIYYLTHRDMINQLYGVGSFAVSDYKVGTAINKASRTAEDSRLYRIDLTQFRQDWSFLIEYTSTMVFNESGMLKLGGEGKSASYMLIDEPVSIKNHKKRLNVAEKTKFQIYFSTPAIFSKGWQFDANEHFEIISASIGKPIFIGGFDMKSNKQKQMYKAVPAGSVYLIKLNKSVNSIEELKSILSINSIDNSKGFGQFEILNF